MRSLLVVPLLVCVPACGSPSAESAPASAKPTAEVNDTPPKVADAAPAKEAPQAAAPTAVAAVGTKAPEFSVPDHENREITLEQHLGKQAFVLAFYPKDFTPG